MNKESLALMIDQALVKHLQGVTAINAEASLVGYNPIEKIRGSLMMWVAVPFNKTDVFCQLRCPNATQLEQCGDISNIILDREENKKFDYEELITIRNYQEALCKLVFNVPTFDEIASLVGEDLVLSKMQAELEAAKKRYEESRGEMTDSEQSSFDAQIRTLELQLGYILPDDTMAFVTQWAMGNDVSDVKRLTRDKLLGAAALSKASGNSPTDHISGVFTDFNKNEINAYALKVWDEYLKDQEAVKDGKYTWKLGRGGKR